MAAYINEFHFSPLFGNNAEDQYVELRGQAGSSLPAGTYLVAISSADGVYELGDIHAIFDLSNQSFGSNGLLVLMESGGGYAVDPAARLLRGTDGFAGMPGNIFTADSNAKQIRTGSNTFLLIQSNVAPALTNDIDSNDDGLPDGAYLNWQILDGFTVFPWVESLWKQQGYAPITFHESGVGSALIGTTSVETDALAYVGRIGQSTGYEPGDWVAGNTVEFDNGTGQPSWKFQFQHGVFGTPRPYAFGGRFLDNVGSSNWVGSVSGKVFMDLNSDGVQQAGEQPIPGATITADLDGDSQFGVFTERIEPNNYPVNSDVSNASSNVTLVSAGSDNVHQGFKIRPVQRFGSPVGEYIFSHENVGFFNEDRRLRMDFYRPARSISIDVIGNSDSSPTYGRLEIFNSVGESLGWVRTAALGANQLQRLSITSPTSAIAWAVAYSENSYLNSSPFGMLDNLQITLPEQKVTSDADGTYVIQPMASGRYVVNLTGPATYDQVTPAGGAGYTVSTTNYENLSGLNFGLLGNLPPVLDDQNINVSEALAAGGLVAALPIAKGYPTQLLTATITSGDPNGLFSLDPATGRLTLTRPELDFESKSSYTLSVKLEDQENAALNDTATIQITVLDANESPKVTAQSKLIAENVASQTLVATMSATDPDAGAAGQVTWSIVSGNSDGAFAVDPTSGAVTVADASKIDYEKRTRYDLVLRATDGGSSPQTADGLLTVTIADVNEAPVLFPKTLSVKENSQPGTLIDGLVATDPDANQTLSWEIVGGSGAGLFDIDASNGAVKTANAAQLDYESLSAVELVVKVTDSGSPQLSSNRTYTITVLNENDAPSIAAAQFDLAENSAPGSVLGVVTGNDQDADQKLSYAISGSSANRFAIDPSTGQLRVADGAELDFETTPTLNITVTVTDSAATAKSASAPVTIRLTNVNESPTLLTAQLSIAENSPAGAAAGSLEATDPDSGDSLSFEILEQTLAWLTIDKATGKLSVASDAVIDFETSGQNVMQVRVTDANGLGNTAAVTVTAADRNDPPSLVTPLASSTATAGTQFKYTIPSATFADEDAGDTLRLFATRASGFPLPSWLSFDAATGVLTGTPTVDDAGTLDVRITALDSGNAPVSSDFRIEIEGNLYPWNNPDIALDVSGDGAVSARDALLVINFLNTTGPSSVQPGSAPVDGLLDTNRDNSVSAIDALLIINDINTQSARGEGEAAPPMAPPVEPVSAWDPGQASPPQSFASAWNADEINRRRRDEIIELLAQSRQQDSI